MTLPPLREELLVLAGPRAHDGQPGWTLQDPARDRFFRLDWLTFEILQRWSLGAPEIIARQIAEQTPLRPAADDVVAVLEFLGVNQLLKLAGVNNSAALARQWQQTRAAGWRWLLHNYLFFRVPLVRPERLLARLERTLGFLFTPLFWRLTLLAGAAGVLLAARQWEVFKATWVDLANLNGLLGFFAVLVGVKVVHEFGHGLAATHFGVRVPTMGIAFLVLTPVAYTDVNAAWNLTARRPRLLISAAGMLAELALAAWATLAWALLPEGYLRSAAFVVATTTWVKSLLINASPIMRFDGYYLLSDALDLPNLHARSFALARWKLREWLFALGEPPPEYFRPPLARGLIALAVFIWVYRLVVFVGIAIFVYHFFFKALGLALFAVEIGWFVVVPVASELKVWRQQRARILRSRRARGVGLGALALLILAAVPLPRRVALAGEFGPAAEFKIVAPENARVTSLDVADGARVSLGQPVLRLTSEELAQRLARARAREASLTAEIAAASVDPGMRSRLPTMQAALNTAEAARRETEVALARLTPTAPFAGVLRVQDCDLGLGETVPKRELIATVIGDAAWQVSGYLDERDRHLVAAGARARFYPDGAPNRVVDLMVATVDRDTTRSLAQPMLTTPFGGSLPARMVEDELVPERGVYRIQFETTSDHRELATCVRRGKIVIRAGSESLLARFGRAAMALVWREAGF